MRSRHQTAFRLPASIPECVVSYSARVAAKGGIPRAPRSSTKKSPDEEGGRAPRKRREPSPVLAEGAAAGTPDPGPLIVGIGGSAGSLSPMRELLAAIPADSGLAFVVVSHQAPTGHSLLAEILAKCTEMPVRELTRETPVEPNHVYVEPRGHNVAIRAGILSPEPAAVREVPHLPIDLFFCALAQDQGSRAAGIVLSGTGTDGTHGLATIRAASGFTLVQDPATAEFPGMPASAIRASAADFVLPPAEMPARLLGHRRGFVSQAGGETDAEIGHDELQTILAVIRRRAGLDFAEYRHATLSRRVARRMQIHGIESPQAYARYMEENDAEIDALWHDWLIGVSSFFRDPQTFEALESLLPDLLTGREEGSPLRIWVPGCATGEEAYSLVIVLFEALRRLQRHLPLQVFATDLNPAAIQFARTGRYPEGIAASLGEYRLAQFFDRDDGFYRITKKLRDLVVFAVQDVLHDPPFTHVDLVSCRNLLIYLEPDAQQRVLRSFQYSLDPRGLLLLGASESAVGCEEFFSPLDRHFKIYRRNDSTAPQPAIRWPVVHGERSDAPSVPQPQPVKTDLASPLSKALAERFGPPAVLVDARGQIQQIHGRIGDYLGLQAGRVSVNVVEMAREALRAPLAAALREAIGANGGVAERRVRTCIDGARLTVHLKASRLHRPPLAAPLFLVSFESTQRRATRKRGGTSSAEQDVAPDETRLERELRDARYDLQGSIDELQAANAELAAANEEAQSGNEELQSTNEELQTAKEEAQSLNEELNTVNAELTGKVAALEAATDDLVNLMNNIEIPTIFLDSQLRVKRFTPQARHAAHLLDADIGRPLADLATLVDYPDLLSDAASVLTTLHASAKQAAAPDGSWYLVRIRPYRTARNAVEGVVITFLDITDTKRTERLLAARALAESIVDAVHEPFLLLDAGLRVARANRAYYRSFRMDPAETEGRLLSDLGSQQWTIPRLRERLEKVLREGTGFEDFEVEADFPRLGRRRLVLNARPLAPEAGRSADLVLLGIQEIRGSPPETTEPEEARP